MLAKSLNSHLVHTDATAHQVSTFQMFFAMTQIQEVVWLHGKEQELRCSNKDIYYPISFCHQW